MTNMTNKIKYILSTAIVLIFSSCTSSEYPNYIGQFPYYAVNNDELMPIDANGSVGVNDSGFVDFVIGGTASTINYDYEGAELDVFMNTRNFINGGVTDKNPVLIVDVMDQSGINTVGNGIGHDITAVIDGNMSEVYVLNDFT